MKPISLAILYGGVSHEHEISLLSAQRVLQELIESELIIVPICISKGGKWYLQSQLDSTLKTQEREELLLQLVPGVGIFHKENKLEIDIALPLTHGKGGEDGTLQGLLELINIPYIGPSPYASMVTMHKRLAKMIAENASIPTLKYIYLSFYDIDMITHHFQLTQPLASLVGYSEYKESSKGDLFRAIKQKLGNFLILKAEDEGSSIGIEIFFDESEDLFYEKLMKVFTYTTHILIELFLFDMVEIECGVMKTDTFVVSEPKVIINPKTENPHILSYKQKYFSDTPFSIDSSFTLKPAISSLIQQYVTHLSEAISLEGFARVDFFYQLHDEKIYFNEINTIPGLTTTSIYPHLMMEKGFSLQELFTRLIHHTLQMR